MDKDRFFAPSRASVVDKPAQVIHPFPERAERTCVVRSFLSVRGSHMRLSRSNLRGGRSLLLAGRSSARGRRSYRGVRRSIAAAERVNESEKVEFEIY